MAPPPIGGVQTRVRTGVGDGVIVRMDLLLRVSSFLNRSPVPVTMSTGRDAVDLALNLPEQRCVVSSYGDTALSEGPRFNLVDCMVASYRYPPRSATRESVDLGGILQPDSGVASPFWAVRLIV